jgi:hypothetical protein
MARESVLDLTLSTQDLAGKIDDWQVLPTLGSDHYGILFSIQVSLPQEPAPMPRFNTKKANWELFNKELLDIFTRDSIQVYICQI